MYAGVSALTVFDAILDLLARCGGREEALHMLNDPKILTGYFVSADSHRVRQVESGLLRAFAQWEFSCSGIKRRKQVKLFFSRRNFFELAYSKHW
jgi:hypothetical protein